MENYKEWRHVFKIDPDKSLDDEALERICESGTDAVVVGGTDNITLDNTLELLSRIRQYSVNCVLEVSELDALTPGFDYYFIPTVLNADDPTWIVGLHHQAIKQYGHTMNWDEVLIEGYCVLNPEAKVAALTGAETDLSPEDVEAYAIMAERMFHLPVFYLEYSGNYGDVEIVNAARSGLSQARLFYGGGIDSVDKAREIADIADTVVIGNLIYTDLKQALKTVRAVKDAAAGNEEI